MAKILSKLGMGRICLISFFLLYGMFTGENALSGNHWHRGYTAMTYDENENSISFYFIFYYYCFELREYAFLRNCLFYYCEDGKKFIPLMGVVTNDQRDTDRARIIMSYKKTGETIDLLSSYRAVNGIRWLDGHFLTVDVNVSTKKYKVDHSYLAIKNAHMSVKWHLPRSITNFKSIKIQGFWRVKPSNGDDIINEVYTLPDIIKANSNRLQKAPSELNSAISDYPRVTCETDAINVTGVEPGEQIKGYTVSGVEVKSVVANDDVVNIKLPTNQMYVVKTGLACYKVAL